MSRKRTLSQSAASGDVDNVTTELKKGETLDKESKNFGRDEIIPKPLPEHGKYLKIMSWNVNGLNSLVSSKLSTLKNLISNHSPDVLCFQVQFLFDCVIFYFL